jgi:hypothetical protein
VVTILRNICTIAGIGLIRNFAKVSLFCKIFYEILQNLANGLFCKISINHTRKSLFSFTCLIKNLNKIKKKYLLHEIPAKFVKHFTKIGKIH